MTPQYRLPAALAALRRSDGLWERMTEDQRQNHNGRMSHAVEQWSAAGGTSARPAIVQGIIRSHKRMSGKVGT